MCPPRWSRQEPGMEINFIIEIEQSYGTSKSQVHMEGKQMSAMEFYIFVWRVKQAKNFENNGGSAICALCIECEAT